MPAAHGRSFNFQERGRKAWYVRRDPRGRGGKNKYYDRKSCRSDRNFYRSTCKNCRSTCFSRRSTCKNGLRPEAMYGSRKARPQSANGADSYTRKNKRSVGQFSSASNQRTKGSSVRRSQSLSCCVSVRTTSGQSAATLRSCQGSVCRSKRMYAGALLPSARTANV